MFHSRPKSRETCLNTLFRVKNTIINIFRTQSRCFSYKVLNDKYLHIHKSRKTIILHKVRLKCLSCVGYGNPTKIKEKTLFARFNIFYDFCIH